MSENKLTKRVKSTVEIPRRKSSIVIPERKPVYITADKLTCAECDCFPKEDPYAKPKKILQCQKTPLTLYELAAAVLDKNAFPQAYLWSVEEVSEWMADVVGLPQYKECIIDNQINGQRLLMLEDSSKLPELNIRNFDHIKIITSKVRSEFRTDFVRFARSIGLPPRKPLTHCTWFKSRTGPSWGIRQNWTRSDILRWMKIIMPKPIYIDHWDWVWYQKPDFPNVKFARIPGAKTHEHIPHYKPDKTVCKEYLTSRKFRIQTGITESRQMIWMEHRPGSAFFLNKNKENKKDKTKTKKYLFLMKEDSRLYPKQVDMKGLVGKDFILARRTMKKQKFIVC